MSDDPIISQISDDHPDVVETTTTDENLSTILDSDKAEDIVWGPDEPEFETNNPPVHPHQEQFDEIMKDAAAAFGIPKDITISEEKPEEEENTSYLKSSNEFKPKEGKGKNKPKLAYQHKDVDIRRSHNAQEGERTGMFRINPDKPIRNV